MISGITQARARSEKYGPRMVPGGPRSCQREGIAGGVQRHQTPTDPSTSRQQRISERGLSTLSIVEIIIIKSNRKIVHWIWQ